MSNPFSTFFKKADRALTALAQSKAALPVLIGAIGVVVVSGVAVYMLTSGDAATTPDASSDSAQIGADATVTDDVDDDVIVSADIDTELYADTVLHESEDAGEEYIANTLFLGDSNTYRYMNYGFADLTNAVGVVGMGVGGIESLECVKFKSYRDYVTIPDSLSILQPQRVVFGFGTNNLGGSVDSYIETYEKAIKACYKAYPYFDIIITAVPPIDKYTTYTSISMNKINKFNAALVEMCEANGWKFLNTSEVLIDPDTGYADTDYTVSDGLHLSLEGCTTLFEYIRTHVYETKDERPKPLDKILERDETPPDLITVDPLKVVGGNTSAETQVTTVDVYFAAAEGGYVSGTLDQTIAQGATTTAVTATPNPGYYFAGWNCAYTGLSSTTDASVTYTVPSDLNAFGGVVVTAYFAKDNYQVTFKLAGATEGATLSTAAASVAYGGSATTNLTLQTGYTAAVSSNGAALSGTTVTVSNVTKDTTITITITAPEGEATPTPAPSASPEPSASPKPTATPDGTTPTPTPTPAGDAAPTPTPEPTVVPAPTAEPTAVPAPTAAPTAVPVPTAAPTAVPAPTEAPAPVPAPTEVPPASTETTVVE